MTFADPSPHDSHLTDLSARRGQRGDGDAYAEAYSRVAPALFAWASLRVRAPLRAHLDPEDLLQEVACRAYEQFANWDPERASFRRWAFGIANNILREALRRLATHPPAVGTAMASKDWLEGLPDDATSISRAVARDELVKQFVDRLRTLDDDDQRLMLYRGLEGMPHGEVASLLALPLDTVTKRWHRLRDRMRAEPKWSELFLA